MQIMSNIRFILFGRALAEEYISKIKSNSHRLPVLKVINFDFKMIVFNG